MNASARRGAGWRARDSKLGRLLGPIVFALSGCSPLVGSIPQKVAHDSEPRWEAALQPTPELLIVLRPQAIRHDAVYGPLVQRALAIARERAPLVVATGSLDAMEDADEVVIGAHLNDPDEGGHFVVVVRGVRANVDPARIVDDRGRAVWAPAPNASGAEFRELWRTQQPPQGTPPTQSTPPTQGTHPAPPSPDTQERSPGQEDEPTRESRPETATSDASLFELPGRTWVIATGRARAHARDAFARPGAASNALGIPSSALAFVRVQGPSLVARVRPLRPPSLLAPIGDKLVAVTVVLSPGDDAVVRATLAYKDEQAASRAEATLRDAIAAFARAKPRDYAWLQSAAIGRLPFSVTVTSPLPRDLMIEDSRRNASVEGAGPAPVERAGPLGPAPDGVRNAQRPR